MIISRIERILFQHTAARRRLGLIQSAGRRGHGFQHTAARRRLAECSRIENKGNSVSTHSRPKAAGVPSESWLSVKCCFNTQPPEGGWRKKPPSPKPPDSFNTQPPEGGWLNGLARTLSNAVFQHTAARRRLAGKMQEVGNVGRFQHTAARRRLGVCLIFGAVARLFQHTAARRRLVGRLGREGGGTCFNTQPPEGGWACSVLRPARINVSTHSRPKAAGGMLGKIGRFGMVSTHSRPKAAGRLNSNKGGALPVSTHSRPKAAG